MYVNQAENAALQISYGSWADERGEPGAPVPDIAGRLVIFVADFLTPASTGTT
jgi:hypothetical protein